MTAYLDREQTKFCAGCCERKPRREFYVLGKRLSARCKRCDIKRVAARKRGQRGSS